jgi:hypothetical protein
MTSADLEFSAFVDLTARCRSQSLPRLKVKMNVASCLTPDGKPFLLNQGRPMLGEEKLRLQGAVNYNTCNLRDSDLGNLGGNAFHAGCVAAIAISLAAALPESFSWGAPA